MEAIAAQRSYDKLSELSRHTQLFASVLQLLEWDQETFMPPGASAIRSEQNKLLAGVIHQNRTSKAFQEALNGLIDLESGQITAEGLRPEQLSALFWWRRDFLRDKALPTSFVEEFSQATSQAMVVWRTAKMNNDFALFAPHLAKIVQLSQRKADLLAFEGHPYNSLLDEFEPQMTVEKLSPLFDEIAAGVKPIVEKAAASPAIDDSFLHLDYPVEKQLAFSHLLLEAMGYDFSRGRLDLSAHPFSMSLHPTDSRITTRVKSNQLMGCLSAALHEGGHSLYEMGLPMDDWGTPLGSSISLGVHESQSRWWECFVGLSLPFWRRFFPLLQREFPRQLEGVDLMTFYRAINKVAPTFIRVEADEVTYPLHVILRFKLEMQLIEGSLKVEELPGAWNELMERLLGIVPPDDSRGCLQDIHWSMGSFGYFPTYALGNMYAAQLFASFKKEESAWEKKVEDGDLAFIRQWLHRNVYRYGRQYNSTVLLHKVTGSPFSGSPYIGYLTEKYM